MISLSGDLRTTLRAATALAPEIFRPGTVYYL